MAQNRNMSVSSGDDVGGGIFTVISVAVLVGTEIMGAALAAGWAIGGLSEFGPLFTYALMAIFAAGGIALLVMFVRSALRVESTGRRV
ncbi:hypothetical protein SAMN05444161_0190 [Rhizobiales bacterium GAS191]|jgi:hypothetical protein|nr:hypothetical protein SAMN05519103_07684 [Rhizobiales bacterium GAS113]SEB94309.1 hypothetical protein SAMN05444161_0190 [Rhizobiales bacterium GAS191]SED23927.1 hypothetical protein SAMN05519104_3112 [Rhizobiales bacterium GAS188]